MKMWWQVVFQVLLVLFTRGMHVVHDPFFAVSTTGVNCIDYTNERLGVYNEGWPSNKLLHRKMINKRSSSYHPAFNLRPPSPRISSVNSIENLIASGDYLVKEHAKLVHDINGLRQVVFISPFAEENKDYDDSIFHEIIDAPPTSTPTPFPISTKPYSSLKGSSIPVIYVGGASQRQVIKSQPINFVKPTISLIGTTKSPVIKHPYLFVTHRKPVKICVTALPPMPSAKPTTKTIWERLIDYFIPRNKLGR